MIEGSHREAKTDSAAADRPRGLLRPLVALHRVLLPDRREIGWTPYLWLFYLTLPIGSWLAQPPGALRITLGVLTLLFFLAVYFNGYWHHGRRVLWNIGGIALLGIVWTPFDSSAMIFAVYAAGFAGQVGRPRVGWRVVVVLLAIVLACTMVFDLPFRWTLLWLCLCAIIGATNIYFGELTRQGEAVRRSQEEVERFAAMAERERISRDLHDLLGHTLSLITVKAELARKLSERQDPRAAEEIGEVERISRRALRQVREAVEGFRQAGFAAEVAKARWLCDSRDIELTCDVADLSLATRQEAALAMILREAMTNLLRHSRAQHCRISLQAEAGDAVLVVQDDGIGEASHRGELAPGSFGLVGMEERLRALGGHLTVDGTQGWRLEARLPRSPLVRSPLVDGEDETTPGLAT